MQATDTRSDSSPVFSMGVASCSFQLCVIYFARNDEISFRTWLRAACASKMGQGYARPRTAGTARRFSQSDPTEVGLHWITVGRRFHPHLVLRFTAPRHYTRSHRPLTLVQKLPNKGGAALTDCTAHVGPRNRFVGCSDSGHYPSGAISANFRFSGTGLPKYGHEAGLSAIEVHISEEQGRLPVRPHRKPHSASSSAHSFIRHPI